MTLEEAASSVLATCGLSQPVGSRTPSSSAPSRGFAGAIAFGLPRRGLAPANFRLMTTVPRRGRFQRGPRLPRLPFWSPRSDFTGAALGAPDPSPRFRRTPAWRRYLEELQSRGLRLIFSSRRSFRPDLVVVGRAEGRGSSDDSRSGSWHRSACKREAAAQGGRSSSFPAAPPKEVARHRRAALVESIVVTPPGIPSAARQKLGRGALRSSARDELIASPALGSDPSRVREPAPPGIAAARTLRRRFYLNPRGSESKGRLRDPGRPRALRSIPLGARLQKAPFSFRGWADRRFQVDFVRRRLSPRIGGDRHGGFLEISSHVRRRDREHAARARILETARVAL